MPRESELGTRKVAMPPLAVAVQALFNLFDASGDLAAPALRCIEYMVLSWLKRGACVAIMWHLSFRRSINDSIKVSKET